MDLFSFYQQNDVITKFLDLSKFFIDAVNKRPDIAKVYLFTETLLELFQTYLNTTIRRLFCY